MIALSSFSSWVDGFCLVEWHDHWLTCSQLAQLHPVIHPPLLTFSFGKCFSKMTWKHCLLEGRFCLKGVGIFWTKYVPFSLNIQVMQFQCFKARSLELVTTHRFPLLFYFLNLEIDFLNSLCVPCVKYLTMACMLNSLTINESD